MEVVLTIKHYQKLKIVPFAKISSKITSKMAPRGGSYPQFAFKK